MHILNTQGKKMSRKRTLHKNKKNQKSKNHTIQTNTTEKKICDSEYSHDLIKNCQYGYHINGVMYCTCVKVCSECKIGTGRGEIYTRSVIT